jgi:pyrroline-5-carboxylate reductase
VIGGGRILLANRTPEKAAALADALGAQACDNARAARESDFLFLGVKPFMMADMLSGIHDVLAAREKPCVLVSMAAGLTVKTIREMAGVDYPIIRINPNTPSAVGKGLVMMCAEGLEADDPRMIAFREAASGAGLLDDVEERLMDAGSAVAGCGPAFAALMLEALADGGVACGLPRAKAQMYAAQMMLGTAALALETGKHPGALKDAVCSPGGTTIQGVRALEKGGFRSAAFEAVIAAYEATLALAKK